MDLPSRAKLMHPVFHLSALQPYHPSCYPVNYQPPFSDCIQGELEWEVVYVGKCEVSDKRLQYFVHWRGYQDSEAACLPAAIFGKAPDKVGPFWEVNGQPVLMLSLLSEGSHFSEGH
jgi:hypothetical protein